MYRTNVVAATAWTEGKLVAFQPPLGQHRQSANVDGIVMSRVFNVTPTRIDRQLQAYNSNSFPVFVEIDSDTSLGNGAYAALAPGERAIWTWRPISCSGGATSSRWTQSGQIEGNGLLTPWGCADHLLQPGTFRLRLLNGWDPG